MASFRNQTYVLVIAMGLSLLLAGSAWSAPKSKQDQYLDCVVAALRAGTGRPVRDVARDCCIGLGGTFVTEEGSTNGLEWSSFHCEFNEEDETAADHTRLDVVGTSTGGTVLQDPEGDEEPDLRTMGLFLLPQQQNAKVAGSVMLGADSFGIAGTISASGRLSAVRHAHPNVVVTGQVQPLADGATLLDGKVRWQTAGTGRGRGRGGAGVRRGTFSLLRPHEFDRSAPPPDAIGSYSGNFTTSSGDSGGATLGVSQDLTEGLWTFVRDGKLWLLDANPTALLCDLALAEIGVDDDVVPTRDFSGSCSISGQSSFVGVLTRLTDAGLETLVLEGDLSISLPPDIPGAEAGAVIEADYWLQRAAGTTEAGTIVVSE
jgi:hypothetical protein